MHSANEYSKATPLTCISCRLTFQNPEEQKNHYKSDLHRFNLKRKVAQLPPVSAEVFQDKVQSLLPQSVGKYSTECKLCNKRYSSVNTLKQHLNSKKHQDKVQEDLKSPNDISTKSEIVQTAETKQTPLVNSSVEANIEEYLREEKKQCIPS